MKTESNEYKNKSTTSPIVSGEIKYKSDPDIVTKRIGKIIIYQITETELKILKDGSDGGIYLNISIALFSIFLSLLISIFTCTFSSDFIKGIFYTITIISILSGFCFLSLWYKSESKTELLYKKIIERIE